LVDDNLGKKEMKGGGKIFPYFVKTTRRMRKPSSSAKKTKKKKSDQMNRMDGGQRYTGASPALGEGERKRVDVGCFIRKERSKVFDYHQNHQEGEKRRTRTPNSAETLTEARAAQGKKEGRTPGSGELALIYLCDLWGERFLGKYTENRGPG